MCSQHLLPLTGLVELEVSKQNSGWHREKDQHKLQAQNCTIGVGWNVSKLIRIFFCVRNPMIPVMLDNLMPNELSLSSSAGFCCGAECDTKITCLWQQPQSSKVISPCVCDMPGHWASKGALNSRWRLPVLCKLTWYSDVNQCYIILFNRICCKYSGLTPK